MYTKEQRTAYLVTLMCHYARAGHKSPVRAAKLAFAVAVGKSARWALDHYRDPEAGLAYDKD